MEPLNATDRPVLLANQRAIDRRAFLNAAATIGAVSTSWLTHAAYSLDQQAAPSQGTSSEGNDRKGAIILVWLDGGPSQLETFDPHPGKRISGETTAIPTSISDIQIAADYPRLAQALDKMVLLRSVVSREGDHERGNYYVKTGYRPDQTIEHPAMGAIVCKYFPIGQAEIPRHIAIFPGQYSSKGGFLGAQYDAFHVHSLERNLPDVAPRVNAKRMDQRVSDLDIVNRSFAKGREKQVEATLHSKIVSSSTKMMTSKQLAAFDVSEESESTREKFGDTDTGQACLVARRLVEVGVRCIEVNVRGWDTHANNFELSRRHAPGLDQALSALMEDLDQRDMLKHTVVICCGEFGRTPRINKLEGRDHWPSGYSVLLAGGNLVRGVVLGQTDPEGSAIPWEKGIAVPDINATVLKALSLNPGIQEISPIGRPIKLSEGTPLAAILQG